MFVTVIKIYLKPNMQVHSVCGLLFLLIQVWIQFKHLMFILHLAKITFMHISYGQRNTTNLQIMSGNGEHGQ